MDTDVSEEYAASILRVEICRMRNLDMYAGDKYGYHSSVS
jgi:hypothetical protein